MNGPEHEFFGNVELLFREEFVEQEPIGHFGLKRTTRLKAVHRYFFREIPRKYLRDQEPAKRMK